MSRIAVAGYPSDVTDKEWEFVLPYLLLCREDSPQRKHHLRRVFNGVRYAARTGGQWRYLPHEYGPWWAVYQQMRRASSKKGAVHPWSCKRLVSL